MNLRSWLQQKDPNLYSYSQVVRQQAEPILKTPIHHYYTDHSISHSDRVIEALNGLTDGLMHDPENVLSPLEVFTLLSAAYLHDIGMQDELSGNGDLDSIRNRHHENTARIINESVLQSPGAIPIGIPPIPGIGSVVALVAKAHRKVKLDENAQYNNCTHGGQNIRPRLLAAFLRLADELDIDYRRVYMPRSNLSNVPFDSQMHWYKCLYVSGVSIENGSIILFFQFPEQYPCFEQLIVPLIRSKIEESLEDLQGILWTNGAKLMIGKTQTHFRNDLDVMPPEVIQLVTEEHKRVHGLEERRLSEKFYGIPSPHATTDPMDSVIINE